MSGLHSYYGKWHGCMKVKIDLYIAIATYVHVCMHACMPHIGGVVRVLY